MKFLDLEPDCQKRETERGEEKHKLQISEMKEGPPLLISWTYGK